MLKLPNDVQSATSTQLVRDLQSIKDMVLHGPVHITTHGREDFVLVSQKDFQTLDHLKDTNAQSLAELVGTTPEAMIGTSLLTLIDPQSRSEVEFALANRSSETHVMEVSYLRRGTQIAQGKPGLTAYSNSQFSTRYALALSDPNWSQETRETTVA